MALTRDLRFSIKSEMMESIQGNNQKWPFRKINLLLREYGCATLSDDYDDDYGFEDAIASLSDADLIEMFELVTGHPPLGVTPKAVAEQQLDTTPLWMPDKVRVFLSHSSKHKRFAGQVASELDQMGICGFVAHDSMKVDRIWQDQIEIALRTMQALVVLLHDEVNRSAWCQQEIGWALGSETPIYLLRIGADPSGFVGRTQYPQVVTANAKDAANLILSWLADQVHFKDPLIDGLITALGNSESFIESMQITARIIQLPSLSEEQWLRLDAAVVDNDQVHSSGGASRTLQPFYRKHKRRWPPMIMTRDPQSADIAGPSQMRV